MSFFLVPYFLSLLCGLVPVLIWLWFWEHEDKHPEPKKVISYAFLGGMAAVILVIPFEYIARSLFGNQTEATILAWAVIEESFKFLAAYFIVLRRKENDEPIDSFIYMITVALGFAALENALFIFPYFQTNQALTAFSVLDLRFMGATVLHIVSSGTIGIFLAISYYKKPFTKGLYAVVGLATAVLLHTLFNLSIILNNRTNAYLPFLAVWLGSVIIIMSLEKVKRLRRLL